MALKNLMKTTVFDFLGLDANDSFYNFGKEKKSIPTVPVNLPGEEPRYPGWGVSHNM